MKFIILIISLCTVTIGCNKEPIAQKSAENLKIDYIKDISLFKREDGSSLSENENKAIETAKEYLNKEYNNPVIGQFSVAISKTGYQINFHGLKYKLKNDKWFNIKEGFGEIFISKDFKVLKSAIGP